MFLGRVEEVSHEGGLLVSYSGACPALGSVMVDSNETYIGKVDGVGQPEEFACSRCSS